MVRAGDSQENDVELAVEKLAEELLWMRDSIRRDGVISGLASLSLTAAPRVEGLVVQISGKYLHYLLTVEIGLFSIS